MARRLPASGILRLRDLDYAIGIDGNHDGAITWGELRAAQQRVMNYAFGAIDD